MKKTKNTISENTTGWIMASPALILLSMFLLIPFILAIYLSFTNQRLITNPNLPTKFIGFENYKRIFSSSDFLKSILNNFIFAFFVVPIQTSLALAMAMLINKKVKFVNFFRTLYFSPVVITMVVVSVVWNLLYNPSAGTINKILEVISFGQIGPQDWLGDPKLALPAIMILSIWQGAGFQMILFLAGLQDIPSELYEAAKMDGANKVQSFFNVTIPMLRNTIMFVVVSTTILSFKLFTQVWVLTQGGPQNATITSVVLMYKEGFQKLKVGYSSALAVLFFLIVVCISMIQRFVLKNDKEDI